MATRTLADGKAAASPYLVPRASLESAIQQSGGDIPPPQDRTSNVVRHAAWELDALIEAELEKVGPDVTYQTHEDMAKALCTRGLMARMRVLCSACLAYIDGERAYAERLEQAVFGRAYPELADADAASTAGDAS